MLTIIEWENDTNDLQNNEQENVTVTMSEKSVNGGQ